MKQLTTTQIWLLSIAVFLALGAMGAIEQKDEQVAEQHAQYVKQEVQDRKNELNRLAFKGEKLTGFAGAIK